ncbi:WEE/WEE1 protein Kinase [Phytophthora palmivora]|uniref:WEE/WEE1 protein Kinase n=1 Tax=Phytophthora palmivora TaxID=4796 RepID=A0A2P4XY03_9STRA|nr:WEE/WEE1 protein Kinase [Phytophthora palmivora]
MLLESVIEEPFTKMPPHGPLAALPRYPIRGAVGVVEKVNKQIQTQEQDDQWEWQRVWKGAFDKIRQQLRAKTEETETLAIEKKELLALVAGYKKALDEAERSQRELEAKHLAEIENLRAVHSLELSDLQARHRQKLQEVALQNDENLFSRRRDRLVTRRVCTTLRSGHGIFGLIFLLQQTANADDSSDFLQYIDDFYSATLHLTAQNRV